MVGTTKQVLEKIQNEPGYLCTFIDESNDIDQVMDVVKQLRDRCWVRVGWKIQNATALHHAVQKGFTSVCKLLVSRYGFSALDEDKTGRNAIIVAIKANKGDKDTLAAFLIKHSERASVRALMQRSGDDKPKLQLQTVLEMKNMPKTTNALLDCLIDKHNIEGQYKVAYDVLEADKSGLTPDPESESDYKQGQSARQIMVFSKNKDCLHHPAVRSLLEDRWKKYGRKRFLRMFIWYLIVLFWLTFCMWTSVVAPDVRVYDTHAKAFRAVVELLLYPYFIATLGEELIQCFVCAKCVDSVASDSTEQSFLSTVKKYLIHDRYNVFEMVSSFCLVLVLPVRYIDVDKHWYFYSVGYLFWVFRIFKYAALRRPMAIYINLLWQLMIDVFPYFTLLFMVLILGFGGALFLALRGNHDLEIHQETSSFLMILLTGVRILAEGQPVIGEYVGDNGYGFWGCLIMLVFIFMIVVVLLNILIAQLTDQLPRSREVAARNVTFKRAQIIHSIDTKTFNLINMFRCCKSEQIREHYKSEGFVHKDMLDNTEAESRMCSFCKTRQEQYFNLLL